MKTIQVEIPDNIHQRAKRLSSDANVSINQFILTSISNEIVREETADFFSDAARQYSAAAFENALSAVPDVPPTDGDEIDE
jgi:hypothetical protein